MRLRRELESRPGGGGHSQAQSQPHPQHNQPPPPNIGAGQSNLFGGIMSGSGRQQGAPGLVEPPNMMSGGHPQSYSGGPANQGGYVNGGPQSQQMHMQQQPPPHMQQQPPQQQSQHAKKRGRGDGPDQSPYGQGSGYHQGPGAQSPQEHGSPPGSMTRRSKNGPPPAPASASRPAPPKDSPGSTPVMTGTVLGDMGPEDVPKNYRKEGADWFAIFNPKIPKVLDVDLVHTLDHSSVVCCVRFSADGKYLATGCNRSAQIYDAKSGQKISILTDDSVPKEGDLYIRSVCFSPDGRYLATGAEDKQIRIWDIAKRRIRQLFQGHEQDIYSLDFSRDGRLIVSGSGDRTARIWDMETGRCVFTLQIEDIGPKDAGVTSVAISQDGRLVAAGSLDKMVRVWDVQTGQQLERLEGHKDSVYSVAFSQDGQTLVSGSLDKTLKLWDLSNVRNPNKSSSEIKPGNGSTGNGNCRTTFVGHKDFVLSVAVSPDGAWVVSGSKDRGVQFWDPRTAQTQFMLQGHKNSVISVALSPAGGLFATGSGDLRARIWNYNVVA